MPVFERGTIVSVPFPYTSGDLRQKRPALVISNGPLANGMLLWVLMITSAQNRRWPDDVDLPNTLETGLPAPSIVRTLKIATIEAVAATPIGAVDKATLKLVDHALRGHLQLA